MASGAGVELFWWRMESPVGGLRLLAGADGLRAISFERGRKPKPPLPEGATRSESPFREAIRQLDAYFAGDLEEFDLDASPRGTPFQLDVWRRLARIPYGEVVSYGQIARDLGRPDASRAVGAANGSNPIPIVIPCHRVVGSDGSLTGFGGGLDAKRWLLRHEAARGPSARRQAALFELA
jgi:methylated-DNA-[protein]-cysteine S-methyltransferase